MCHRLDQPMVESLDLLIDDRYGEFLAEHGYDDTDSESKDFIRSVSHLIPVDLAMRGGELVRLSADWTVELMHTPGHSGGSMSVWDPRSATMIIGDAVLGTGLVTRDGRPAFPPTYRYVEAYRTTIERLECLPIETFATAHYPLYSGGEVGQFLALSRIYADRVEQLILDTVTQSRDGISALELISSLHDQLGPWDAKAALALMYPVIGHLECLTSYRAVRTVAGSDPMRWRRSG